ncbi:juvenile hormone epoxide hydrolase-like [Helicoverpa zea]|uniref:juvenile hormone epoxide hydrolase-like n=1 Tax=Helicoverpa zea TaxID=7113 RepID=UPI001F58E08E|nr:juvenile hormone epoxide hydrolase-like [Helicoverpa zea]XP_047036727.1 juvenile hormone epoxide hydrolase-like [Helicoverpa zea]
MSNKKPLSKSEKLKNDRKNEKRSSSMIKKSYILLAIFIAISSATMYGFKRLTTPPETPKVDLQQWWGKYPIDMKKDTSIKPYKIEFSDVIVNDLKERLLHRRSFTPPLENAGFTYGFNTHFLAQVLDFWQNKYNFKEREQFLNKYDHYLTNIQGLDIHFLHVKPKPPPNVTVVPILLMHGWPGSFREFYELIPKLITPRPNQDFVFEIIAPSIPGFGYSQAPVRAGMGPIEVSVIFRNLMARIGHEKYYIQGGDYGSAIGSVMATLFPEHILGYHTNMPMLGYNAMVTIYTLLGSVWPSFIVEPELADRMYPLSKHMSKIVEESGYFHIQATKPDTVGVALSDSPAGLAAYILEKFSTWTNMDYRKSADGSLLNKFSLTHLLDNVMIYWASNTITSSMRHYAEGYKQLMLTDQIPTDVPTWGIKFKHEISFFPDSILKLKYKNYLHSSIVEDGGHFPAMELPDVLADDIFDAVHTFREFHSGGQHTPAQKVVIHPEVDYEKAKTVYEFTVKDSKGQDVKLDKYKGKVLIIVNVASQCGYTNVHYEQLNQLHERYNQKGLRILAFPCNQFGGQEPGSMKEILQFTKQKKVKFDLFEKIEVNGDNAHPLWKFLKKAQGGLMGDFIKWNFSKFIVDRNGIPVERFGPNTNPLDLEPYLAKLWG